MNAEKGHSQSADNSQLLAHKSSPQGGHAFKLKAPYEPTGDQPQAIAELVKGFKEGNQCQTLLGVTAVSYTHLDVYKRQRHYRRRITCIYACDR